MALFGPGRGAAQQLSSSITDSRVISDAVDCAARWDLNFCPSTRSLSPTWIGTLTFVDFGAFDSSSDLERPRFNGSPICVKGDVLAVGSC